MDWKITRIDNDEWDVMWTDLCMPQERFVRCGHHQKMNHFPAMYHICRKNLLAKNLKKMERFFPNEFKIFPKTWVLPHEAVELRNYVEKKKVVSMIVKPECLSQGKGIYITKRIEDINLNEHLVVQKYMKNPYLIDGCKFDLRIYVMVLS